MAPRYHIAADLSAPDALSSYAPRWVVGFVRFKNQNTFDLKAKRSVANDDGYAMDELTPLVLHNAVNVTVQSTKTSHVTNMSVNLAASIDYLSLIMPGDWVVCNMVYSDDEAFRISKAMEEKTPINGWNDGFKFLGRVQGIRKNLRVLPNGQKMTGYSVECAGFTDFDSALFYHPQLVPGQTIPAAMNAFGLELQDICFNRGSMEGGTIDINKVLPRLMQVVFGVGFYSKGIALGKFNASPNQRFLVPTTIFKWLGVSGSTFADVVRPIIGLQHYRTVQNTDETTTKNFWELFKPDGLALNSGFYATSSPMTGSFPPAAPQFNTTVWSLLSNYLNAPVNEMYVTLRADPDKGRVLPHFIVRQNPYTTDAEALAEVLRQDALDQEQFGVDQRFFTPHSFKKTPTKQPADFVSSPVANRDVTDFQELPRWVADETILCAMDVGRSEAGRVNFIHLSGVGLGQVNDPIGSFVRAPPNMDELDIKRSGLRPYITSVNCYFKDLRKGPTAWRDLMTDVMMGQQLALSGQFTLYGVRAPIAVGDNFEFDGVIYHIESIAHSCGITGDGQRSWVTSLQVSHGIVLAEQKLVAGRQGAFVTNQVPGNEVTEETYGG